MKLRIATPAYRDFDVRSVACFASATHNLAATWDIEAGDPNQARARNVLLHRFLASDADRLLCIDQDSTFTSHDLSTLASLEEDVVSAIYLKRTTDKEHVGIPLASEMSRGPLLGMEYIGFGCVSISRSCAELISNGRPTFVTHTGASAGQRIPDVFSSLILGDDWLSPDFAFSHRWRQLGGTLWVHRGVHTGHVGSTIFK